MGFVSGPDLPTIKPPYPQTSLSAKLAWVRDLGHLPYKDKDTKPVLRVVSPERPLQNSEKVARMHEDMFAMQSWSVLLAFEDIWLHISLQVLIVSATPRERRLASATDLEKRRWLTTPVSDAASPWHPSLQRKHSDAKKGDSSVRNSSKIL